MKHYMGFTLPEAEPEGGGGWWNLAWIYACLLVGLMCVSMSSLIVDKTVGPLYMLTSRKVILFVSYSEVNLIDGCKVFI